MCQTLDMACRADLRLLQGLAASADQTLSARSLWAAARELALCLQLQSRQSHLRHLWPLWQPVLQEVISITAPYCHNQSPRRIEARCPHLNFEQADLPWTPAELWRCLQVL